MVAIVSREMVLEKVSEETRWWVDQRMKKLRSELHETMAVNPFLIPILFDLHHAGSFAELGELLLAGHLMAGHSTGFGRLVDDRLLPRVFGTHKLNPKYRRMTTPLSASCFDDIDHLVPRQDGAPALLSLKAGRWTIQLASAVNLNRSFAEILERYPNQFSEIAVDVFYGTQARLTDKYAFNRRYAQHCNPDGSVNWHQILTEVNG